MSNHSDILNDIPKEKLLSQNIKLDFNSEITERTLGLLWDVKNDKLTFRHSPRGLTNTKRAILSLVTFIFVPLETVTTAVLEANLIIRSLWKLKLDWDDNILPKIYYNVTNNGEVNFIILKKF